MNAIDTAEANIGDIFISTVHVRNITGIRGE